MESIPVMFRAASRTIDCGIEGYHVDNKYFDARRSKEEKAQAMTDRSASSVARHNTKKITYLDELMKAVGKNPGPTAYDPHEISPKVSKLKVNSPPRKTIFDEMETYEKKRNYPAAGKYDVVDTVPNKKKLKSNLSKAEVATYLDNSMRGSIDCPGVG